MNILQFKGLTYFSKSDGTYTLGIESTNQLNPLVVYLKNHSTWRVEMLTDITTVDTIQFEQNKDSNKDEFLVVYNFLSLDLNFRLQILLKSAKTKFVSTLTKLFKSAGWLEREIWDMFGAFFRNNDDLRRLLTDYGFIGHPLRKFFPVAGFLELFYKEFFKRTKYQNVELMQVFRTFKFVLK